MRRLPLGIGHIRTHTHDYIRHGTVTLFAALNYLDGKIVRRTETKHTHVEWLHFLKQIELYPAERNKAPKLYRWHATGEEILAKTERARTPIGADAPWSNNPIFCASGD